MNRFRAPAQSIGALDADTAAALVTANSDIALVVDSEGVIRDLAGAGADLGVGAGDDWLDQPMASTVTVESQPKVAELLDEAGASEQARWRHVNHVTRAGELPILYSAVPLDAGSIIALGRDMRPTAELQQRLVDAQHEVEREYAKLRQIETRYRLLFQMSREAVLVIDPATGRIVEANPSANELLGVSAGQPFPAGLDGAGTETVTQLMAHVQATGSTDEARVRTAAGDRELGISASLFRDERGALLLVRAGGGPQPPPRDGRGRVLELIDGCPDGFVVTGTDGRVLSANAAFLELAQLTNVEQAVGRSIDQWLGRPGVDLSVLAANLREHGAVRLFSTTVRGEQGVNEPVEISAVQAQGPPPCFGFVLRSVGRRPARTGSEHALPQSAEQLTELVGRVPLKDLVRETTDLIERLCIEAALEITGDNRASAAEMLGLSRQSLYVKLRRYGVTDTDSAAE